MVETIAENVENSKVNDSLLSAFGSIGVGLCLGLIYHPSMWYIGFAGSSIHTLINAYVGGQ